MFLLYLIVKYPPSLAHALATTGSSIALPKKPSTAFSKIFLKTRRALRRRQRSTLDENIDRARGGGLFPPQKRHAPRLADEKGNALHMEKSPQ